MEKGKIYALICPIDKKIRYIGQTTQALKKRLNKHLYHINEKNNHKNNWLKKLKKESLLQDIEIELLEECSIDMLDQREVFWIEHFKNLGLILTNITTGGKVGSRGYKHTEESKKKISKAGKKLKGIKRSEETRKKISLSLIGKPGRNTGNKHSKKTKNKISKTKKGTLSWNATPILQFKNEEFIKEWRSAHDAAKNLSISQGNIWSVIHGKRKTCGGYKWKIKNE